MLSRITLTRPHQGAWQVVSRCGTLAGFVAVRRRRWGVFLSPYARPLGHPGHARCFLYGTRLLAADGLWRMLTGYSPCGPAAQWTLADLGIAQELGETNSLDAFPAGP